MEEVHQHQTLLDLRQSGRSQVTKGHRSRCTEPSDALRDHEELQQVLTDSTVHEKNSGRTLKTFYCDVQKQNHQFQMVLFLH